MYYKTIYLKQPHTTMNDYLNVHGWHFSKKLCDWAISRMKNRNSNGVLTRLNPYSKEDVTELLNKYGVTLLKPYGYDCVYVANMCKADFLGSSVSDEEHLAKYIKDLLEDPDGYTGLPFRRFLADCIGSGVVIPWKEVI